jgi:oligopeptide/dipeptide ABC transporter ATP-binding protein
MGAFVDVEDVTKDFVPGLSIGERIAASLGGKVGPQRVRAVDRVTLGISKGEVLGLVGESGCGKSTLGRIIAGILSPTSGSARIDDAPLMSAGRNPHKVTTRVQMIFQDPFASLDPRMRIGDTLGEGPVAHGLVAKAEAPAYVREWLRTVGLDPDCTNRFPHQFSGGQRQRIAIARALAMKPDVLVCDEPLASLDVSIQAQIINLFLKLRREFKLTMLFISHDLGVVRHLADRVAIMYLGRIVELGEAQGIYNVPTHPYTMALLDSVPKLVLEDEAVVSFRPIGGEPPSPLSPPSGCHFHQRCPIAQARCRSEVPALRPIGSGRTAACHLVTPNSFH